MRKKSWTIKEKKGMLNITFTRDFLVDFPHIITSEPLAAALHWDEYLGLYVLRIQAEDYWEGHQAVVEQCSEYDGSWNWAALTEDKEESFRMIKDIVKIWKKTLPNLRITPEDHT